MTVKRLLALAITICMMFTVASFPAIATDTIDDVGVRLDENGDLLYRPEDVGQISNPVVTGLVSPAPDNAWLAHNVTWKEQAYGIDYAYDTCAWGDRDSKWVAAYVGGTPYDIITRTNFPTTAVKGLLKPLDDILPVDDERYFNKEQVFNSKTYGVTVKAIGYDFPDCGELYGVWYNKDMFEDNGLTTPAELWENGEWTFDALLEASAALTQDVDSDSVIDIYGYGSWAKQLFTIGNGAPTVEFKATGVELAWNQPAYIAGLEFMLSMLPYSDNINSDIDFMNGTTAMHGERIQNAKQFSKTSPNCVVSFEADWVPFPKGPNGEGYMGSIGAGSEIVSIGEGSKNVEGAKVWICGDIIKFEYVSDEDAPSMVGVTEEMLARALSCEGKTLVDYSFKIGNTESLMHQFWNEIPKIGIEASIEQYTPYVQNQIDILMDAVEHNHVYDNDCDMICNQCDALREVPGHIYTAACDSDCNVCGAERNAEDHTFDNACDLTCNVCGGPRTTAVNAKITGLTASNISLSYPYQRYGNDLSTMFDGDVSRTDGNGLQLNWSASEDQKTIQINLNEAADITALNIHWGNNDWNAVPAQTYYVFFAGEDGEWGEAQYQYTDNATDQDGKSRDDVIVLKTTVKDVKKIAIVVTAHYKKGDLAIRELEIFEEKYVPVEKAEHLYDNACDTNCNICGTDRDVNGHVYDDDFDTTCNECGYTRPLGDVPTFVVESKTVKAGETFTVDVAIKNNSGIIGLRTYVAYDEEVLELVSITAGENFSDTSFGPLTNNPISILWDDSLATSNNTTNGTVSTLTFKVKEGVEAGNTAITLTYIPNDVYDFNWNNVEFGIENGTVSIIEYVSGDVNGDGEVNNKDFGTLRRFLNDWDVEIDELASDVNRDGAVNNKDLGILRRYLNDWDVELK